MAVTAVYIDLCKVNRESGTYDESRSFANIGATTASFKLRGGTYGLTMVGSTFGTVTLQKLAGDGSTWVNVSSALAANGYSTYDLPEGDYRFALA